MVLRIHLGVGRGALPVGLAGRGQELDSAVPGPREAKSAYLALAASLWIETQNALGEFVELVIGSIPRLRKARKQRGKRDVSVETPGILG